MTATVRPATVRPATLSRRWRRTRLRWEGRLEGEMADRMIPWLAALLVFAVFLALDAAALRSLEGGSGLAPWLQAAWRRQHGWAGHAVAGIDPARGSWSWISEPVLFVARFVPPVAVFALVQAAAIGIALVPLWRLARDEAHLRVGATTVVTTAFALAPALHRANLTAFHPELLALPALLWAYLHARRDHWWRYGLCIVVVLACRADLGLTVAALGVLLMSQHKRRPGLFTILAGVAWTATALVVVSPQLPAQALTPAGEFVARATTPLAMFPEMVGHPVIAMRGLLAEPSVLFLVVVLAPLLFFPLMSLRAFSVALPCLVLAMLSDRAIQHVAQEDVLSLAPAAAHVGPSLAFVFVGLVFALERMGEPSVLRVNVDRRVLLALLAAACLFFVTDAPTSPYRAPWNWGSQDAVDGARLEAADLVGPYEAVAASPGVIAQVAGRAHLIELPLVPQDMTRQRVDRITGRVDAAVLDTTGHDPITKEAQWTPATKTAVFARFRRDGFQVAYAAEGIYLLRSSPRGRP